MNSVSTEDPQSMKRDTSSGVANESVSISTAGASCPGAHHPAQSRSTNSASPSIATIPATNNSGDQNGASLASRSSEYPGGGGGGGVTHHNAPSAALVRGDNEAKAAAQKRSRLLSLSLLGTATFIAIVAGVITGVIVYLASVNSLEQTAAEKGEVILEGASLGVNELQDRVLMNVEQHAKLVQSYNTPMHDHNEAIAMFNETLYHQWSARIHDPHEIYSYSLRFFFPPVPDDQFIPQEKEKQLGCRHICARPGDPTYNSIASFSVWSDILVNGSYEYMWAEPQSSGNTSATYRLRGDRTPERILRRSEWLYTYRTGLPVLNGSYTAGHWTKPFLWVSSDKSSYYYFTYIKLFRHLNVSYVSSALSTPHRWFAILKKLIPTSDKEFLLLTDGFDDKVLAFSGDKFGDKRLWNCSFAYDEASAGITGCKDLSAKNHEHWFVRDVGNQLGDFIRTPAATAATSSSSTNRHKWTNLAGGRHLVITKDIFRHDDMWVIATYAMHEDKALRDLESRTIPTVVICAMIVVMASVFLATVGYIMIRRTHKTVEIVAEVAYHISRYDIESGEAVLARSAEANDGNEALRGEFENILDNLRAYRAFLPAVLQHPDSMFDSVGSSSGGVSDDVFKDNPLLVTSSANSPSPGGTQDDSALDSQDVVSAPDETTTVVFAAHRLRTTRLRSIRGTVMLVSIGDISTKHADRTTKAINSYFSICSEIAKVHGGVVDNLSANGVVISFNYHVTSVKHEEAACRCGLAINERLNKSLARYGIHPAISISSGFNLVGTCGSEQQKSRVVIGEAVDMLYKISVLQRRLNCEIVVSEQVAAGTIYATAAIDVVTPSWTTQQRTRQMTLFQLRRTLKHDDTTATRINEAMTLMMSKKPDEAQQVLEIAAKNNDSTKNDVDDKQVKRLMEVCRLQRERILSGYSRAEIHWEQMESASHLAEFLTHITSSGQSGEENKYAVETDDTERAMKELKEQQRAKEVKMTMKDEEEGESLFSIFVAEPKEKEKSVSADAFEVPKNFVDVRDEKWKRCDELIGRGQFGEVYTCISETGTMCALKAFPISSTMDVDSLVKETEILQKMRHEHVAGYVSCAVLEHHFMIMMEYLSAGTLRKLITNVGEIPTRAAYKYLQDVLHGLVFLHQNDLAHCDLKPDNCLFAGDGTCKLADFGTAKLLSMDSMSGVVRGTPRYMAPEAANGAWRMPADIYSLGIILIEMVTGKNPWKHVRGDDKSFLMRLSNDPTMAPRIPDDMDPKLKSIAEYCLQRDPTKRPTAEELLAKLLMA